jgi:hypothetical protein
VPAPSLFRERLTDPYRAGTSIVESEEPRQPGILSIELVDGRRCMADVLRKCAEVLFELRRLELVPIRPNALKATLLMAAVFDDVVVEE